MAVLMRDRLADDGVAAYPKTSGKKGMQLCCPISGTQDSEVVSAYARKVAEELSAMVPGSITAKKPYAAMTAYAASKAGVLQMSRLLAKEWARKGICVNAILPGYIQTEMTGELFDEGNKGGEWLLKSFPRRALTPISAMDVPLLFFCSDLAAHVTGAEMTVDDGQSL